MTRAHKRFFNTAGECDPERHYMIDPLRRLGLARQLIDRFAYFVVHAPRQSGKTTTITALAACLLREGRYAAARLSLEVGRAFPHDPAKAQAEILRDWATGLPSRVPAALAPPHAADSYATVGAFLTEWARSSQRPLVLFLDEVDALTDETMLTILSQIRSAHGSRPKAFPASIVLVGMRDVRDYMVASGGSANLNTSSPFNVKEASLTLREFTHDEVSEFYGQHTHDTGQRFGDDAIDLAFHLTQGQPWLVNALAREATDVLVQDRAHVVTAAHIDDARERLILRKDTHFDSLLERLREHRVRAVIEPILAGTAPGPLLDDDLRYCIDLGLIRRGTTGTLRIANPIYHEVIPRALASIAADYMPAIAPSWLRADGGLDQEQLLAAFLSFWRQHGEPLMRAAPYHEIAPHLVLMAFLHRVANGRGRIEREYAVGSGRMDLLLTYGDQRLAIELKVWRPGEPDPKERGLAQLDDYLASLGLSTGWLVVFDRRPESPRLGERAASERARTPAGRDVALVRA